MASQQGNKRPSLKNSGNENGILARVSRSVNFRKAKFVALDIVFEAKEIMRSTGKAAWLTVTTFLILGVPLMIAMEREQQLNEQDLQQASLLGSAQVSRYN